MPISHHYRCTVEWTGAEAGPTVDTKTFSRDAHLTFGGQATVEMSTALEYQGNPSRVNPEELFTSSLAACQMYSYLYVAARSGIKVLGYSDTADGELSFREGKMRIVRVTLRPQIAISTEGNRALAESLVERAHQDCFIANSVACEVIVEATLTIG